MGVKDLFGYLKKRAGFVSIFVLCLWTCRTTSSPVCEPVTLSHCVNIVNTTQLPNLYGDYTQDDVDVKTSRLFRILGSQCTTFNRFLCVLYLPPCPDPHRRPPGVLPLPCRQVCEGAREECNGVMADNGMKWPYELQCHAFPTENCVIVHDSGELELVDVSLRVTGSIRRPNSQPVSLAPLETEVGDNEEYSVEVVSMTTSQIPQRRYDVIELGDEELYHGWADVQGTGAANDYCRILGRGKRRFLSCALAGSSGQGHHYVSKLGFDSGHKDTWFMRDVDNDGRDDYCRCVGRPESSKISCMKSGDKGFYGSTVQGGSQYTFELPGSTGCHDKKLNPQFGA
ncbi:uncharacterized protein LOC124131660 [Haliotis rufescens]|uniref:uncharacterized protein LOC124131660 n=1 Tax=Haliotis rufescens TaxID=6454 RepID=UPI001EAFC741|nr:uncharacterized protein LOC124131660 [Haliotis rufescens]